MSNRVYKSSKTDILLAAKKILLTEGLGNLTTDNIIKKSGMSKGGFFYHFKTKNELIEGLMFSLLEEMELEIYTLADKDPNPKGATLRALIHYNGSEHNDESVAVCRSLIEILFSDDKESHQKYLEFYKKMMKRVLSEDLDKTTVIMVLMALDGYWYNEVFGIQMFTKKDYKLFLEKLLQFTL